MTQKPDKPLSSFDLIREKTMMPLYQILGGLTAVSLIMIGCIIVLFPFFPAILLATILALSAWPAFVWVKTRLNNNTTLASWLMTIFLAICFIVPLIIIGNSTTENFASLVNGVQASLNGDNKAPAELLAKVPYIGEHLTKYWIELTADRQRLNELMQLYGAGISQRLIALGTTIGRGLLDLTLGVLIAFFFFRHGTYVAERTSNLIDTFGGRRGQYLLEVCKTTLIGVVYGILGTALAQGALAAFGFWLANVPGASFLGLLTFFLSFIPGGTPIIWLPVAIWLFQQGMTGPATFVAIWGFFVVSMIDNVLRPYFISRGSNLPFLPVLLGVIGGMIAFGFIGVFIGPTLLALAYALILGWSGSAPEKQVPPEEINT